MQPLPLLFNADGPVGYGARSSLDFESCPQLLKHMDRLGIERSLVWSIQARDQYPDPAHRTLLADIRTCDPHRRRLTPSLVIGPPTFYERRIADATLALMKNESIAGLRLFPRTGRFQLHHAIPFLEKAAVFKPALFIDVLELDNDRDIGALAGFFPAMPMVLLHGSWGHFYNFSLLALLRRHTNILVDNSVMHSRGTLEKIVTDCGADRIVFACPHQSSQGASVAHLARAPIPETARRAIAHGTLEKILHLPPSGAAPAVIPGNPRLNRFWQALLEGHPLPIPLVDAHGHLGAVGHWPQAEHTLEEQIPIALDTMAALNIQTMIISSVDALFGDPLAGNRRLEELAGKHAGRLHGYVGFNPHHHERLTPAIDSFFTGSFFVGFKALCGYWNVVVTDPRFEAMWRYADQHHLPILYHTWGGHLDSPAMLEPVVTKYPGAFFILGHSGGSDQGRIEAEELALKHPHVYLEWCGSFCSTAAWEKTLERVGFDRLVFGTDAVLHDTAWELGRLLSLPVPEDRLPPILGETMRRLLAQRI